MVSMGVGEHHEAEPCGVKGPWLAIPSSRGSIFLLQTTVDEKFESFVLQPGARASDNAEWANETYLHVDIPFRVRRSAVVYDHADAVRATALLQCDAQ